MNASRPLVLVTNDDGIQAPGLHALARAAHDHGLRIVVAAPHREASGASAALTAITRDGRVAVERTELSGLPGVPGYGVTASPGYIASLAVAGGFGDVPDLVLSGINRGANAGHAILHSGTVGAALTAANRGARAMAVSLDVLNPAVATSASGGAAAAVVDGLDDRNRHWDTAAALARRLLPWLIEAPAGTVLNLNVPDRPAGEVALRRATLAPFGQTQMTIAEAVEGFVRVAVAVDGARRVPGTDITLLGDGYATVTAIQPVGPDPDTTPPV